VKAFRYERPKTLESAVKALAEADSLLKANGLDVLDRMKERVDEPARVVTLIDVPHLTGLGQEGTGPLKIGSMVTLAALADSAVVKAACPALAKAAGEAASPQLRNRATVGGNLAQHTRCGYYRMKSFACFKRGDSICPVRFEGGVQELAGVFSNNPCACAHPSSLAPVLGAAGASIVVRGPAGERRLTLAELYEPPKQGKASDTTLAPGDVIERVEVPVLAKGGAERIGFHEIRQRVAFDWALVSCSAWVSVAEGKVTAARIWLGAVAPMPWHAEAAEKALVGKALTPESAAAAGEAALAGATALPGTAYKLDLVKVAVKRCLLGAEEVR